jgi:hypothetical protein
MIDEAPPPHPSERRKGGEACCHEKLNPEMCDASNDAISSSARNKTLPFLLIFIRKRAF